MSHWFNFLSKPIFWILYIPTNISSLAEASISFKKKLEPKTVEERETVTLEVELTKPAEVKWMRNSIVLKPSDKIEIKAEGTKHTLVVKDISFADRGFYCCESPDDKTQAKINVESEFSGPQFYKYPGQGLEVDSGLCIIMGTQGHNHGLGHQSNDREEVKAMAVSRECLAGSCCLHLIPPAWTIKLLKRFFSLLSFSLPDTLCVFPLYDFLAKHSLFSHPLS